MTIAVDTNVLLDILFPDEKYQEKSLNLLLNYAHKEALVISGVVYAELAVQFSTRNLLNNFLLDTGINVVNSSREALFKAADAWKNYIAKRTKALQCSCCGKKKIIRCDSCNEIISSRQHILADFVIGGHALVHADRLLTRDRGFYRSYFKELEKIDVERL